MRVRDTNPLALAADNVIDRDIYHNDAIYAAEIERIFKRAWLLVGHESELKNPGDFITTKIIDQALIVTRGKDGALNAFYNNCTHRGAALTTEKKGNCRSGFRCMYHGWSFDTTGKLTGVPRPSNYGTDLDRSKYNIPRVQVDSHEGVIFINLDTSTPSLAEYLGEDGRRLISETCAGAEVIGRVSFRLDGNWKIWPENYRDGYHPEYAHPVVQEVYRDLAVSAGTIASFPNGHSKLWWPIEGNPANIAAKKDQLLGLSGTAYESKMTRPPPPFPVDYSKGSIISTIFPNMDIQLLMGGSEHCLQITMPMGPNQSRIEVIALGPVGEKTEWRQWRLEKTMDAQGSSGKVSADDCEAASRIQHVIASDGTRWTPMARGLNGLTAGQKTDDHALRGYYEAWYAYMGAAPATKGA